MRGKEAVQEQSLVAHCILILQIQKNVQYRSKMFCLRDQTLTVSSQMFGNYISSFFQEEFHGIKFQKLSEDLPKSWQYASLSSIPVK